MALTKDQKKQMLDKLVDRLKKAKSVIFSGYTGIDVKSMTGLRKQLKGQNIDYLIIKKTLLKIGTKEAKLPEIDESMLQGPIAVAISYGDEIAPIKILYGMSRDKNFEKKLELYGGFMEGKILSKEEVMVLATIPSKQELFAKLVYLLKSPVSGFHFILHETMRKFVGTLDALKTKKPAAPAAETKTAAAVQAPAETPASEASAVTVPIETPAAAEIAAPTSETPTTVPAKIATSVATDSVPIETPTSPTNQQTT